MEIVLLLPSLPVPEMTIASGAGLSWADSQTRSFASNQRISGTGSLQGNVTLNFVERHLGGQWRHGLRGVPNTVARKPAESERPVAGPGAGWDCGGGSMGCAEMAQGALHANAKAIGRNRLEIPIIVTIAATALGIDDALRRNVPTRARYPPFRESGMVKRKRRSPKLAPLVKLIESARGHALPLPQRLARLYGTFRIATPRSRFYVFSNFVSTLDGVVSLQVKGHSGGGDISGFSGQDRMVMGLLRRRGRRRDCRFRHARCRSTACLDAREHLSRAC